MRRSQYRAATSYHRDDLVLTNTHDRTPLLKTDALAATMAGLAAAPQRGFGASPPRRPRSRRLRPLRRVAAGRTVLSANAEDVSAAKASGTGAAR